MRVFLIFVFAFILGFFFHAAIFPDYFYDGFGFLQKDVKKSLTSNTFEKTTNGQTALITYVNYENKSFRPKAVIIERGRYVAITNISKKDRMSLESNNKLLTTVRGYGEGERLQVRMDEVGTYEVHEKNNPTATLTVTVKDVIIK